MPFGPRFGWLAMRQRTLAGPLLAAAGGVMFERVNAASHRCVADYLFANIIQSPS